MDGMSPELEIVGVREKAPPPPPPHHGMERIGDTNTAADGAHNMVDDVPLMHFPANTNWPMPAASGLNAAIPTQFTILFNGNTFVYDGIPAEKVQEIMLIAAAYAKSAEMKIGTQSSFTPLIHTTPSSPQGNSNNLASQQSVCFPPPKKSSICRLQEFPIARRQSLQRFLEKRRFRLGSRAPYASSSKKMDGNMENNFYAKNAPDLVSKDGFQASIAAT